MIGPGTGVAPFLGFLKHDQASGEPCENLLFFGARHCKGDFLYGGELPALLRPPPSRLVTAFSRDQAEKIYVQHRIRQVCPGPLARGRPSDDSEQEAVAVWSALSRGGQVYVCGDGWRMAGDVHAALVDVAMGTGEFKAREDADAFIKSRTSVDVWVS
jgi:sulfite reductase (NADPH) flavoprotein alpha-component